MGTNLVDLLVMMYVTMNAVRDSNAVRSEIVVKRRKRKCIYGSVASILPVQYDDR